MKAGLKLDCLERLKRRSETVFYMYQILLITLRLSELCEKFRSVHFDKKQFDIKKNNTFVGVGQHAKGIHAFNKMKEVDE